MRSKTERCRDRPMYEFLDAHGERVTIRSVRTLAELLQQGAITAATPFRRAEDAAFGPAAKHPELRAIAAELGLALDGAARATPLQAPAPPAQPAQPTRRASVPAVPPRVVPPTPAVAIRPTPISISRGSPWSRFTPPPRAKRHPPDSLVGSAGIVLLNLASAAVLGTVARFVVADASHSRIGATLSMVAVTAFAGHYAGSVLASRVPRPTGWAVSLAAAIFAMGCYGVAEAPGLVVAAAAAVPLWRRLSDPRPGRRP